MRIPHTKPTLAMSIGILLVATAWSSVAIASQATPAAKPTSQPRSSIKAHPLQALSPAERTCHKAYSSIQTPLMVASLGKGVPTNTRNNWETRMSASCGKLAKSGDAITQGILGDFYSTLGWGTIPAGSRQAAYSKAVYWYRKAAAQGNAGAQINLGWMYANGQGVPRDYAKALYWARKAAAQGGAWAQSNLGLMYDRGQGIPQDHTKAAYWYRKAAAQGNADAQFTLGLMYDKGHDVPQDYAKALYWFRKAAAQGDAWAQYNLGLMYANGQGVTQDYAKAAYWYRKAAAQGVAYAQNNLGLMYDNGQGVTQDYAKAVYWYRKAAAQGDAGAQGNLGVMYYTGHGVHQSGAAAADWYYKAGIAYLSNGDRDGALSALQRIKFLQQIYGATLPNGFLANKLFTKIYGGTQSSQTNMPALQKKSPPVFEGTGWPVAGGFIVTNYHVIAGAKTIWIILSDGTEISASVAASDTHNDLVLLKVKDPTTLPSALPLAKTPANVGERVFTVGYPQPDLMGTSEKLTEGIVSATSGLDNDPRLYQISVPLQKGNSGGPLLNMQGAVVGITAEKLDAAKVFQWTGDLPENVNYAIKIAYLKALLQSVQPQRKPNVLNTEHSSLVKLDKHIAPSIVMIIAKH